MGTLTVEDVRTTLGLEPFERFRERHAASQRAQGLTTEMLVRAIACASDGHPVYVRAASGPLLGWIMVKARMMAEACGVDPKLLHGGVFDELGDAGRDKSRIFCDHYVPR